MGYAGLPASRSDQDLHVRGAGTVLPAEPGGDQLELHGGRRRAPTHGRVRTRARSVPHELRRRLRSVAHLRVVHRHVPLPRGCRLHAEPVVHHAHPLTDPSLLPTARAPLIPYCLSPFRFSGHTHSVSLFCRAAVGQLTFMGFYWIVPWFTCETHLWISFLQSRCGSTYLRDLNWVVPSSTCKTRFLTYPSTFWPDLSLHWPWYNHDGVDNDCVHRHIRPKRHTDLPPSRSTTRAP